MKPTKFLSFAIVATTVVATAFLANPAMAQLKVGSNPTAVTPTANLETEATDGTKMVILKATGNVGIGTAAPTTKLEVTAISHDKITIRTGTDVVGDRSHIKFVNNSGTLTGFLQSGVSSGISMLNGSAQGISIDGSGNVGIGTGTPVEKLQVSGGGIMAGNHTSYVGGATNTATGASIGKAWHWFSGSDGQGIMYVQRVSGNGVLVHFYDANTNVGSITTNGTTTAYNTTSDRRLKENIKATQYGLKTLMQLSAVDYTFKADKNKRNATGFIAQDLFKAYPAAVTEGSDELDEKGNLKKAWSVDYGKLTPLLVKAMQEQQAEIEALRITIDELRVTNKDLGNKNAKAEARLSELESLKAEVASIKAMMVK